MQSDLEDLEPCKTAYLLADHCNQSETVELPPQREAYLRQSMLQKFQCIH